MLVNFPVLLLLIDIKLASLWSEKIISMIPIF